MNFTPDYRNILDVLNNKRPKRLPLYEHLIDYGLISKILGKELSFENDTPIAYQNYYKEIINFWKDNTYDAFSWEVTITDILPGHGAINGGMLGPIQTRDDFDKYPFEDIPKIFWETYTPHLDAISKVIPNGMKAYGGCGNGIFEISEDLVGFESLAILQFIDPELFTDLYKRIGDLYMELLSEMIKRYDDMFVFYRMGDDLGFKTSTLLQPEAIRDHILPQYKRIINYVHQSKKKFLLHSCGCIFSVMEDIIELGIDAKHSNEDEIAPFEKWIDLYNDRIGLFGGIDVNDLCLNKPDEVYKIVLEKGTKYRKISKGFGLGSGNSITDYVPPENFLAMIEAAKEIRRKEELGIF